MADELMIDALVEVVRPNGKIYRPRKPPRSIRIDDWDSEDEPNSWVYVLGTHDIERAWQLAQRVYGTDRDTAEQTWIRHTMRDNEHCYDLDDIRGAAAVTFEVWE